MNAFARLKPWRSGACGASTKGDLAPPWTPHFIGSYFLTTSSPAARGSGFSASSAWR